MRNSLFSALLVTSALVALPAFATAESDIVKQQKKEMMEEVKQETVALGGNRFLLFSGSKAVYQYAYGVELLKIEGGVPKLDPLFMEEYDNETKSAILSAGVGFAAQNYHFDKATGNLDFTARDVEEAVRYAFKYKLVGDTFRLMEVAAQDIGNCGSDATCKNAPPNVVFSAADADKASDKKKDAKKEEAPAKAAEPEKAAEPAKADEVKKEEAVKAAEPAKAAEEKKVEPAKPAEAKKEEPVKEAEPAKPAEAKKEEAVKPVEAKKEKPVEKPVEVKEVAPVKEAPEKAAGPVKDDDAPE